MRYVCCVAVLVLVGGLLFAVPSWAQESASVSGVVTDEQEGQPLPGANVVLRVPDTGTLAGGAATNINGQYQITGVEPGDYMLVVRYVGYQEAQAALTLAAGEARTVNVALTQAGFDLESIVVTASRQAEKVLDAPASISVLEPREIEQIVAPSSVEALRNTTGVDMAQTGVDRRELVLRGFNNAFSGATYTLTDYRQAAVPSLGVNIYSIMPNMSIDLERIEVVRGPGSALYGAGVDAGVIHFITKDPFNHPGTTVALSGGERSTVSGQLRHAGVLGARFGYKITGTYAQTDDWELDPSDPVDSLQLAGDQVSPRRNDYEKYNVNGMLQYRVNDQTTLTANVGFSSLTATVLSGIGTVQADGFGYTYGQLRLDRGDFFAQAYFNKNDAGDSFVYDAGRSVVDNGVLYNAQAQYDLDVGTRHQLIVGADLELTRPDTEGTILGRNEDDDNIDEYGVYAQSTTSATSKLDVTLALRGDYNNVVDQVQVSPRAALVYKVTPQHTVRTTYNRAFSSPGTNSNFLDIIAREPDASFPIPVRGRGSAHGFTFERNPAYAEFAPTDLVASSLNPATLGQDQPVGLSLGPLYRSIYAGLAARPPQEIAALLHEQGIPGNAQVVSQLLGLLDPDHPAMTVEGFSGGLMAIPNLSTGGVEFIEDVTDIQPLDQTISQTVEVGYKGLLQDRFLFAVDAYYVTKKDFVGPLMVETPLVLVPALEGGLTNAIESGVEGHTQLAGALQQFGVTPERLAEVMVALASEQLPDASTPVAIIQPRENNPGVGETPELMLAYRNFGNIQYWGVDASLEVVATERLNVFGNVSVVSDDFFDHDELDEENEDLVLALNAPTFKAKGGFRYTAPSGLSVNAAGRFVKGFPVLSGPYEGEIDDYFLLDVGAGYDLNRYVPGLRLDLTVNNVLDNEHREFIGAPELGRLAMVRLTYSASSR